MNYVQQLKEKIAVKNCAIETIQEQVRELAKDSKTISQEKLIQRIEFLDSECERIAKISNNI